MMHFSKNLIGAAIIGGVATISTGVAAQTVSIGTLPQGSLAYGIASAAAKVMSDKAGLTTRAVGFGGSNIFIPQVNQGRLEMSTANAIEAHFAKDGTGTFPGRKNPNLRALARLFAFQTSYMVKKDSRFQKVTDFKGQSFPSGFTSQKIVEVLVRNDLDHAISPADFWAAYLIPAILIGFGGFILMFLSLWSWLAFGSPFKRRRAG